MEITDRVKESVEQNSSKPELFGNIVRAAVALLERLIAKVMQKVIGRADNTVKKILKDMDGQIHVKTDLAVLPVETKWSETKRPP